MNRLRSLVSLVLLAALQVGAAFALLRFGEVERWQVEWTHLGRWIDATPRIDVAVALGRWVALVVVVYLLATMALYLLACLTRIPSLVRATGALTVPTLRRAVEGTVAVGLSASVVLGAHAAGAAPISGWADRPAATVDVARTGASDDRGGPATAPAVAPSSTDTGSWEVARGDNLWAMACGVVSHETGVAEDDLADWQIEPYWHAIMDANPAPSGDPNLIYPEWQVILPPFDPAIHAPGLTVTDVSAPTVISPPASSSPVVEPPTMPPVSLDLPVVPTTVVASPSVDTPALAVTFSDPPVIEPTVVEHPVAPETAEPTPTIAVAPVRKQSSGPPFVGMAILATGIGLALNEARRYVARRRKPGEMPEAPNEDEAEVEEAITSNADGAQAEFISLALRALAGATEEPIAPLGVTVDDDELTVILADPAAAPAPFCGYGTTWTLPRTTPSDELVRVAGDAPFAMPALVCLGKTADGVSVYVDLEEAGLVSVVGEDAAEVINAALLGLATAPWPDHASVIASGYGDVPALGVHSVVDALACIEDLDAEAHRIGDALKATVVDPATGQTLGSTFEARCRGTADDAWTPTVLVCAEPPDPETTQRLVNLVSKDTAGVAAIVAGPIEGALWTLRCDGGRMDVGALGLTVTELQQVSQPVGIHTVFLLDKAHRPARSPDEETPASTIQDSYNAKRVTRIRERPQVVVRVLGPIRIDGAEFPQTEEYSRRTKALEALVALVLHDQRVDSETLFGWLWPNDTMKPADTRLHNTTNQLRRFLRAFFGTAPDGSDHLPGRRGAELYFALNRESVGSDFGILKHALEDARYEDEATSKILLREALEWVAGPEMFAHRGPGFAWVERDYLRTDAERMVVDAAAKLARLYLDDPDVIDATNALWAIEVGLRVVPGHETLTALAMEAHHHLKNPAGVEAAWQALEDDDPSPDVVEAHERYSTRLVSVG